MWVEVWVFFRNLPLGSLGNRDSFSLKVFSQTAVKLRQASQLEISHGLLVLLDLRRIADVPGGVLRHDAGSGRGIGVALILGSRVKPRRVLEIKLMGKRRCRSCYWRWCRRRVGARTSSTSRW